LPRRPIVSFICMAALNWSEQSVKISENDDRTLLLVYGE